MSSGIITEQFCPNCSHFEVVVGGNQVECPQCTCLMSIDSVHPKKLPCDIRPNPFYASSNKEKMKTEEQENQ